MDYEGPYQNSLAISNTFDGTSTTCRGQSDNGDWSEEGLGSADPEECYSPTKWLPEDKTAEEWANEAVEFEKTLIPNWKLDVEYTFKPAD